MEGNGDTDDWEENVGVGVYKGEGKVKKQRDTVISDEDGEATRSGRQRDM